MLCYENKYVRQRQKSERRGKEAVCKGRLELRFFILIIFIRNIFAMLAITIAISLNLNLYIHLGEGLWGF